MFIDSAFLKLPPPAAGELEGLPGGLPEVSPQLTENSEFSDYLAILEHALPATPADGTDPLLALLAGTPAEQPMPPGGEALPQAGEQLPLPILPLPQLIAQAAADAAKTGQAVPSSPGVNPGAAHGLTVLRAAVAAASGEQTPVLEQQVASGGSAADIRLAKGLVDAPVLMDGERRAPHVFTHRQLPPVAPVALPATPGPAHDVLIDSPAEPGETALELLARSPAGAEAPRTRGASPVMLQLSVDRPNWQPTLGERLVWMVSHGQQRAEIMLDPPQLGRVDVQLVMQGDRAQLVFAADTPLSRELLEQSLPRLREMMAEAGIELTDVNVGSRQRQAPEQGSGQQDRVADTPESNEPLAAIESAGEVDATGDTALLDLFV